MYIFETTFDSDLLSYILKYSTQMVRREEKTRRMNDGVLPVPPARGLESTVRTEGKNRVL